MNADLSVLCSARANCRCANCSDRRKLRPFYPEMRAWVHDPARGVNWFTVLGDGETDLFCSRPGEMRNRWRAGVMGLIERLTPSPEGDRVAFTVLGPQPGVYVLYADAPVLDPTPLDDDDDFIDPWSFDARVLVRVTRGKADFVTRWLPDGRTIEFTRELDSRGATFRTVSVPADARRAPSLAPRFARYTALDLYRITNGREDYELDRGMLVANRPIRPAHQPAVQRLIGSLIWYAGDVHAYAWTSGDYDAPACLLTRKPDTVRFPLAAFVRPPRGYLQFDGVPDLVIDAVRRGETLDRTYARAWEYVSAGCAVVWAIDARRKRITEFGPSGCEREFYGKGVLENAALLPGFHCPVGYVFGGEGATAETTGPPPSAATLLPVPF